jgi:replication factor C subunit 3/5
MNNVFVEKYRPTNFNDIVLDNFNKKILLNIVETTYFPNLLFYGPPGTGKTTTIINLINMYQDKLNQRNKELIIHLNASDERGIDIIRNQINQFVSSNSLFNKGMKFVILDEVDYMTKNAQQALKYLLQNYSNSVRFCLICNYISKIDEGLQNEFVRLRFNQLPKDEIIKFLEKITKLENLNYDIKTLEYIQKLYKSDMRSMINFIQTNQDIINSINIDIDTNTNTNIDTNTNVIKILNDDIWNQLYKDIKANKSINDLLTEINIISIEYNIDKKNIIKDLLNYIIRYKLDSNNIKFLDFVENIIHLEDYNTHYIINYCINNLSSLL